MIWEEMTYNKFQQSLAETEPEELFEYSKKNTKYVKKTCEDNTNTTEFILK